MERGASGEATMEAGGFYNRHSRLQAAAAEHATGWLAEAAAALPLPPTGSLTVADYGAAQGHNSMGPMSAVVDALRARTDLPISVVHTDLPDNDFASVFHAVQEEGSYLRGRTEVFPYAIGRSFYDRLFPEASVQLGWSATTTHWLSSRPTTVAGHINPQTAPLDVREPFTRQAADDWAAFLWNRAAELVPGGRMVLAQPCSDDGGLLPGLANQTLMDDIVAELVDEGLLTAEQAAEMTLPVYVRSPEEHLGPIEDGGALRLLRSEITNHPVSVFEEEYQRTGDAQTYAEAVAGSARGWGGHMLFGHLPPEQAGVEDEFFARYVARGAAEPDLLHQPIWNIVMELERPA